MMTKVAKRSVGKVWLDVIFALFAREIRTGFNDKFGISWALLNPLLFILLLSLLRGKLTGGDVHGIPIFQFMAYGLVFVQLFLQTFNSASGAINKNKQLFAFRQVRPISAVIASALFELLVKLFVALGLGICVYFLRMDAQLHDPLMIVILLFELWLCATSIGLIFGLANLFVPEVKKIEGLMTRPLFFISGIFFSLQDIPKEYWPYLDWNPILHAVELARYSAYPEYGADGVSFSYLNALVLSTLFLSLLIYQRYWKEAISQ